MRARTWVLTAIVSITAPASALAQPVDSHAVADEEFRQGREAMNQHDYKRALKLLRTSNSVEPGRGKLLNIASCEEQLGMVASALRHYTDVLAQLPAGDERAGIVKQRLAALGPRVPHLRIEIAAGAPAGTTVTVDGDPVAAASLGTDLAIDPGKHVISATALGRRERRYEVLVGEGSQNPISVEPEREAPPVLAPPPPALVAPATATVRPLRSRLGVGAIGVGGASLIVGGVTGALAVGKNGALHDACKPSGACPPAQKTTLDAFHTLSDVSTATVIVGAALGATGIVLVALPRRRQQGPSAWIGPTIGAGTIGVEGSF